MKVLHFTYSLIFHVVQSQKLGIVVISTLLLTVNIKLTFLVSNFLKAFRKEGVRLRVKRAVGEIIEKMQQFLAMAQPELYQNAAQAIDNAAIGAVLQQGDLT